VAKLRTSYVPQNETLYVKACTTRAIRQKLMSDKTDGLKKLVASVKKDQVINVTAQPAMSRFLHMFSAILLSWDLIQIHIK